MKLSLKEFFVHEARSSSASSAKHSSVNIDVHSSAQINIKERQDPTCQTPQGSSPWSDPAAEFTVKKFFNNDGKLDIDEGGEGSGRKEGSKNGPSTRVEIPGHDVDLSSLPDDLPDHWFGADEKSADVPPTADAAVGGAATGEPELDAMLSDPELGKNLPTQQPKMADVISTRPEEEPPTDPGEYHAWRMGTDKLDIDPSHVKGPGRLPDEMFDTPLEDLQQHVPEIAQEFHDDIPNARDAKFAVDGMGRFWARMPNGKRYKYQGSVGDTGGFKIGRHEMEPFKGGVHAGWEEEDTGEE
jgi:hypothetical protein